MKAKLMLVININYVMGVRLLFKELSVGTEKYIRRVCIEQPNLTPASFNGPRTYNPSELLIHGMPILSTTTCLNMAGDLIQWNPKPPPT
ncbi:hypothetical protein UY3_13850 [Chelonia mydas]|uniref:Uncharacterized protein n=1 Tax=Chelonia mydas TaxID=8469 RepID=M7B0T1_CHEMY|nr:hypothetical protein UY3_13850 [Chelonia mydas]